MAVAIQTEGLSEAVPGSGQSRLPCLVGSAGVQPAWCNASPEDTQPPVMCAARALTAAITGCNRAGWIFLCWILNPPELPAFTMSPSREFHRLNIDRVKKNLLFLTLDLPSAHFILIHLPAFLEETFAACLLYATRAFKHLSFSQAFFSKQKDQAHDSV